MNNNARLQNYALIILTVIIAVVLTILPLPVWASWLRPAWVPMLLIYWALALPHRVSVGIAWIVGLLLDVLQGTLLGEQAVILTTIIYIVVRFHPRMRLFPWMQQSFVVFGLMLFCQLFQFLVQGIVGVLPMTWLYWIPPFVSALLWPWLFVVLRDYRRRFNIA